MRNGPSDLTRRLAAYLLSLKVGDQILSARELTDVFGVSLGSVSAALNQLEQAGAVEISRRGRLGSSLQRKSSGMLWNIAESGPMVIALTLPSFPRCEGLATALYSLLNNAGIETYIIFMRGSTNRIKALRHGQCHAVVLSELAADELCTQDEEVILRLPPRSFVEEHRIFFRHNCETTSQPLTVGYDPESLDVRLLTELEFAGQQVNLQVMTFTQIDLHLEDSSVDAAITNGDFLERLTSKGFTSRPISPQVRAIVGDRYTSAALAIRAGAAATKAVLQEILVPEEILAIQQKVVSGLLVPRY